MPQMHFSWYRYNNAKEMRIRCTYGKFEMRAIYRKIPKKRNAFAYLSWIP